MFQGTAPSYLSSLLDKNWTYGISLHFRNHNGRFTNINQDSTARIKISLYEHFTLRYIYIYIYK